VVEGIVAVAGDIVAVCVAVSEWDPSCVAVAEVIVAACVAVSERVPSCVAVAGAIVAVPAQDASCVAVSGGIVAAFAAGTADAGVWVRVSTTVSREPPVDTRRI